MEDNYAVRNASQQEAEIVASNSSSNKCNMCDPESAVPHALELTRFRVANLCCAGEEKLIRSALHNMIGIDHIAINSVGRYAVVKHCTMECCSPRDVICNKLNDLRLGVTIQEVADNDQESQISVINLPRLVHVVTTCCLFIIGLILHLHEATHYPSIWVFVACVVVGIYPILNSTIVALFYRRALSIHVLISIAIAGAIASGEYFDAALVVALFIASEFLESTAYLHVQKSVNNAVKNPQPTKAFLSSGESILVENIKVGDTLAVRTGEMILCDGKICKGEAVINESALTGESVPIVKSINAKVLSGTLVQNGYIEIIAERDGTDSTMNKLQQAVQDMQAEQGFYSNLVDQFSQYWTPFVLVVALCVVLFGGGFTGDWSTFVHRGLIILVLACPCAIVISAPVPCVSAIAIAAKNGVLIRGSAVIERMSTVTTIAADKTGTLTKGFFQVHEKLDIREETDEAINLELLVVALEQKSTHPLASAIVSDICGCIAEASDLKLPEVRKVKVLEGVGMEGWVEVEDDWKYICVGNERLLKESGGKLTLSKSQRVLYDRFLDRSQGMVCLLVVLDDEICMLMSLVDEIRPEAVDFISATRDQLNLRAMMLTGDQTDVAMFVCRKVGIRDEDCHARLLPHEKLDRIEQAQTNKTATQRVLMIGDGINDSTALAKATVGVAMGAGGTAMAVAAADVVLMDDNLQLLPPAIKLCRMVRRNIIENCSFSIGVKIVAIIIAILGLVEFWQAIVLDIGTLILVLINGTKFLRLDYKRILVDSSFWTQFRFRLIGRSGNPSTSHSYETVSELHNQGHNHGSLDLHRDASSKAHEQFLDLEANKSSSTPLQVSFRSNSCGESGQDCNHEKSVQIQDMDDSDCGCSHDHISHDHETI